MHTSYCDLYLAESENRKQQSENLDLLSPPTGIGVSHIGRWLDLRRELEGAISNADKANNCSSDDARPVSIENDTSNKDVDCSLLGHQTPRTLRFEIIKLYLHTPLPRNYTPLVSKVMNKPDVALPRKGTKHISALLAAPVVIIPGQRQLPHS